MISDQQDGQAKPDYSGSEQIVNKILVDLKAMKTGWRAAFKSQVEVDRYKEQLLKACVENGVNSIEMIERGLSAARMDESDFFPSIGKFIRWCKPVEHHEHIRMQQATREFRRDRALPKLRDPEVAKEHLEKMKKMFGRK